MPDDSTVSCYDDHARAYDDYQSAVVPHYDDMLEAVAMTCQRYLGKSPRILDLGSRMVEIAREKIEMESPGSVAGYRVADISSVG